MTTHGGDPWTWTWRRNGKMSDAGWLPLDFEDRGGPDLEVEPWGSIRTSIYTMARDIFWLEVLFLEAGLVELRGQVTSERTKERVAGILRQGAEIATNEIEVTSPFESASDDLPAFRPMTEEASARPSGVVDRYPWITPLAEARAGESFAFEVDLRSVADHGTEGSKIELESFPPDWTEVEVVAEVFCNLLDFDDDQDSRGIISVFPDGSSAKAAFKGQVRTDAGPDKPLKLRVVFWQGRRIAGSAVRRVPITSGAPSTTPNPKPAVPPPSSAALQLRGQVRAPTLDVLIIANDDPGKWTWRLDFPRKDTVFETTSWKETIDLGGDTREYARRLLKKCPELQPGLKHVNVLRGIGEEIWRATPACFKKLYAELRRIHGSRFPIQITTDEPHVPWEMMYPDADSGIPDADHLFMTHPMARWIGGEEGGLRDSLSRGQIHSFVPDYRSTRNLPSALDEGRQLREDFGAMAGTATHEGFTGFLISPPASTVSVLHFAGHAAAPNEDPESTDDGLQMSDSWVSATELHGGVSLGSRDGTFVILNACSAGAAEESLGAVSGWPAGLARRKFGGVLAPIWAVQDELASPVVLDQLKGLLDGRMLGETLRDARVTYRKGSATPFAYLCYGDVMARMA